jgi:HK97 family phage major capsid protein
MNLLAVLEQERAEAEAEENEIAAAAASAGKLTDDQRARLEALKQQLETNATDIAREQERQGRARTAPAASRESDAPGPITPLGPLSQPPKSIGERFVESDEWKLFVAQVAPNGFSERSPIGRSPAVQFESLGVLHRPRAAVLQGGVATSAGALVVPGQTGIVADQGLVRPLTIRDIITVGSTDSDAVEYVKLTGRTNNAAPVPEADSADSADTTGLKPESAMTLARVVETVKTLAHWIPATKRALSDAGQLRTLVDAFLRDGLAEELEDQIITGDGTGENFMGLANVSGTQAQPFDTDLLTTTRRARTKVRTVGRARATAYLMHPNDWEDIDLLVDNEARFYGSGPFALTPARLWGLPVVESEACPEGTAYVGDFRKIVLWDREQASIQASDAPRDFFLKNMVAILAEMRAAMGVIQPNAFVEIDLTA